MFDFSIHFTWADYFAMILFCTLWNCGFKAITAKGKLLYFITEFFSKKIYSKHYYPVEDCSDFVFRLKTQLPANWMETYHEGNEDHRQNILKLAADFLKVNELFVDYNAQQLISNITLIKPVEFYKYTGRDVYSDLIKDPIVICITCMASFHGFILYTATCIFNHHGWNPFEQIVISVPVAFTGEFLYKLKLLLEKK